ncbi:PDZ domain-containing protein [Abyssisolibacter fermentans]|uniref:PDZ domain-containing protein n=1 Tax=Abyssisolibacter fermentans TaxID=1766203 RepID=UPI000835C394|nr:PDZ domain-containing protein [Abyssisolibacter fermentans]
MNILSSLISYIFKLVFNPIYILMSILVFYQYNRLEKKEMRLLGRVKESYIKHFFIALIKGLAVGVFISIMFDLFDIEFNVTCFKYAFVLSILFFLVKPRYACIAYSGAGACIIGIFLDTGLQSYRSVLLTIAILHFAEGILIYFDGYKSYLPLFLERENKLIGGFSLYRYWCVPFFIIPQALQVASYGGFTETIFLPIAAILGYTDLSITDSPKIAAKTAAKSLVFFSMILILLIALSYINPIFLFLAMVSSPLMHELIILKRQKDQNKAEPSFTLSEKGVRILDVLPNGLGKELGLSIGDELVMINNMRVITKNQIIEAMKYCNDKLEIIYIKFKGNKVVKKTYKNIKDKKMELLILTDNAHYTMDIEGQSGILQRFIGYFQK